MVAHGTFVTMFYYFKLFLLCSCICVSVTKCDDDIIENLDSNLEERIRENLDSLEERILPYSRLATSGMEFKNYRNAPDFLPSFGSFGKKVFGKPDKNTGQRVAKWDPTKDKVGVEELGSYAGGDILIPVTPGTLRNGLVASTTRWPGGIIPFVINGKFSSKDLDTIYSAMNIYHEFTCIKFVPWQGIEPDYVSIENTQTGCWASVGRLGGRQMVNLQTPGCVSKIGTPLHELMHAIGFLHEQNRYERDAFVQVIWENIAEGKEDNFKKAPKSMAMSDVQYDYNSVMHYTTVAFSSNGSPTLSPRMNGVAVGQREGLSRRDVQKIRLMYKCDGPTAYV